MTSAVLPERLPERLPEQLSARQREATRRPAPRDGVGLDVGPPFAPAPNGHHRRRIVLTTFGSLGDLHPYVAIALGLQARGHEAIIATSACYRDKVEALGLGFRPVRPDRLEGKPDPDLVDRVVHAWRSPGRVFSDMFMPMLEDSYADTLAAADGADLLLSHTLAFTTRLVAEATGTAWASSVLQPLGFFSGDDPPTIGISPVVEILRWFGPSVTRPTMGAAKWLIRGWSGPWHRLRAELGLPPTPDNPAFEGQHSPALVLALFSDLLGGRQCDWPERTVVTGFPFFDKDRHEALPPALAAFLDQGPPPIVFTLGTTAVLDAGDFYRHSAAAAAAIGRRAVLLIGSDPRNRVEPLPPGVVAFDYAPYSAIFPRAAAVVHPGGIGTTGQAMCAGRPMLVMPYAHDQPDNAARVRRLGIARTVARWHYTPRRAAEELTLLLEDPAYARRAAAIGEHIRAEDGVATACDALERVLQALPRR